MGILRVFLALIVLLAHAPYKDIIFIRTASVAVLCFFIISGFYIQLLLARPTVRISDFYLSRFFRIYPLYWLTAGITYLFFSSADLPKLPHSLGFAAAFIFTNLTLFGQDAIRVWSAYNIAVPLLPHSWSLAVEVLFYAVAPFFLRLKTGWLILFGACSAVATSFVFLNGLYYSAWLHAFFPCVLVYFICGALGYRVYARFLIHPGKLCVWGMKIACLVLSILLAYSLLGFIPHDYKTYAAAIGSTCLLIPLLFALSKDNGFDRWVGNLSYPIYITHISVIGIVRLCEDNHAKGLTITLFATALVSIAAYYLVEKPLDSFRHRKFPTDDTHILARQMEREK